MLMHLRDIGYGHTESYAQVAAGSRRAVLAVGTACATKPLPVVVPCHRVCRGAVRPVTPDIAGNPHRHRGVTLIANLCDNVREAMNSTSEDSVKTSPSHVDQWVLRRPRRLLTGLAAFEVVSLAYVGMAVWQGLYSMVAPGVICSILLAWRLSVGRVAARSSGPTESTTRPYAPDS
jgi:O-6-methylguanine DNA methyltransferase